MSELNLPYNTRSWLISQGALLAALNGYDCTKLELARKSNTDKQAAWKNSLDRDWDIRTRKHLIETLEWLYHDGHSKSFQNMANYWNRFNEDQFEIALKRLDNEKHQIEAKLSYVHRNVLGRAGILAWDLGRYAHLVRTAYFIDMINEQDAWALLHIGGELTRVNFTSWYQYGISYCVGRMYWKKTALSDSSCDETFSHIKKVLVDPNHPWQTISWDIEFPEVINRDFKAFLTE